MDIGFLTQLKGYVEEEGSNAEVEITLDDGSIFTTFNFSLEQYENDLILLGAETTSSPSEFAFFPLSRIHHIVVKSRRKKKICFHLEDLSPLNKPQEFPEKNPENTDK